MICRMVDELSRRLNRHSIGKTGRRLSKTGDESDKEITLLREFSDKVYRKWRNELERKIELKSNPITVKSDKVNLTLSLISSHPPLDIR